MATNITVKMDTKCIYCDYSGNKTKLAEHLKTCYTFEIAKERLRKNSVENKEEKKTEEKK